VYSKEEVEDIADFEKELGIRFKEFKGGCQSNRKEQCLDLGEQNIQNQNRNRSISQAFREEIQNSLPSLNQRGANDKVSSELLTNQLLPSKEEAPKRKKINNQQWQYIKARRMF